MTKGDKPQCGWQFVCQLPKDHKGPCEVVSRHNSVIINEVSSFDISDFLYEYVKDEPNLHFTVARKLLDEFNITKKESRKD